MSAVNNTNEVVNSENLVIENKTLTGKGNLVTDNKAKSANNTQVINNRICFNLEVMNEDTGEVNQVSHYVSVTLWRNEKNAAMFDKFAQLKKGAFVNIEGTLDIKPTVKNGKMYLNEFCLLSKVEQIFTKKKKAA